MTDDTRNPHDQGEKVSAAIAKRNARLTEIANQNIAARRIAARDEHGNVAPKLSPDDWETVVERISNGETNKSLVMRSMGVTPFALERKCERDPEYAARIDKALADGYVAVAQNIQLVTRGVEGFSSGDVRRDELIAKYDLALARAFAPKLAEKLNVNAIHSVAPVVLPTIALPVGEDDDDDDGE